MESEEGENGKRKIRLFCPSVSKLVQIIAWEDQKLDLGSIALAFGLDPNTMKLNGHFISRGVDLIASSVTWKSLIEFFSSRGLSTGAADSDALLVDGKLPKIGSKRSPEEHDSESETSILDGNRAKRLQLQCNSVSRSLKRKLQLEDVNYLKRRKIDQAGEQNSGLFCSFFSQHTKRYREEEMVSGSPFKRIRWLSNYTSDMVE